MIIDENIKLSLRAARSGDLEKLRGWKNSHSEFFFQKTQISFNEQLNWYKHYKVRRHDKMFIVELNGEPIGCMGIRLVGDYWDVYNVILGNNAHAKKGYMSMAFKEMLTNARQLDCRPIRLNVLTKNPACFWYQKRGFVIIEDCKDYLVMQLKELLKEKDS